MSVVPFPLLVVLTLFASAGEPPAAAEAEPRAAATPAREDAVRILLGTDPEYLAIDLPAASRVVPEASTHVVVYRGGVAVFDRGLRKEKQIVPKPGDEGTSGAEEGWIEDAEVAADGRFAVLLSTRYRTPFDRSSRSQSATTGRTELTWIEPAHPKGLWSISLEQGRWVKRTLLLSAKRGVAVSTCTDLDGPADLRLFDPEGTEILRLNASEASVLTMATTAQGAFLAVDRAYPDAPGVPNREVLVLDLLQGTRWDYAWSYGGDGEPTSWNLADTGVLEVTTPLGLLFFDRNGKPMRGARKR